MESTRSKRKALSKKEVPFGENILRKYNSALSDHIHGTDSFISRQEFLRLLEIKVNR